MDLLAALIIDTACSSGLVALHVAIESMQNGDCEMAIVGGASIKIDLPNKVHGDFGVMSPTGKCRSFSADADGTVGGEGIIAFLLKPLEKAITDHDNIHSIIKGSAVNQDGARSNGLTAPSPIAQKEVIQAAWQNAKVDPLSISYIETHGSATKLGDPIEITGLTDAFKNFTTEKGCCPIGAVKTNIGHLGNVAGLAGLLKTVLCLKYRKIPSIVNFTEANPYIDFDNSPVFVNTELRDCNVEGSVPLRAGVSSFGLSGTNCHVVLEEASEANNFEMVELERDHLIVLAGYTKNVLQQKLDDLKEYLKNHSEVNLTDLSFTLINGRRHYDNYRCALVAKDREELLNKLSTVRLEPVDKRIEEISAIFLLPDYQDEYAEFLTDYMNANFADEKLLLECNHIIDMKENPKVAFLPLNIYLLISGFL